MHTKIIYEKIFDSQENIYTNILNIFTRLAQNFEKIYYTKIK